MLRLRTEGHGLLRERARAALRGELETLPDSSLKALAVEAIRFDSLTRDQLHGIALLVDLARKSNR